MTCQPFNLARNKNAGIFTCTPREAVIASHAQSLGDWNTWDYEECYGALVVESDTHVTCGDYTCRK